MVVWASADAGVDSCHGEMQCFSGDAVAKGMSRRCPTEEEWRWWRRRQPLTKGDPVLHQRERYRTLCSLLRKERRYHFPGRHTDSMHRLQLVAPIDMHGSERFSTKPPRTVLLSSNMIALTTGACSQVSTPCTAASGARLTSVDRAAHPSASPRPVKPTSHNLDPRLHHGPPRLIRPTRLL